MLCAEQHSMRSDFPIISYELWLHYEGEQEREQEPEHTALAFVLQFILCVCVEHGYIYIVCFLFAVIISLFIAGVHWVRFSKRLAD